MNASPSLSFRLSLSFSLLLLRHIDTRVRMVMAHGTASGELLKRHAIKTQSTSSWGTYLVAGTRSQLMLRTLKHLPGLSGGRPAFREAHSQGRVGGGDPALPHPHGPRGKARLSTSASLPLSRTLKRRPACVSVSVGVSLFPSLSVSVCVLLMQIEASDGGWNNVLTVKTGGRKSGLFTMGWERAVPRRASGFGLAPLGPEPRGCVLWPCLPPRSPSTSTWENYLNHSCDANLRLRVTPDLAVECYAARDIPAGGY